MPTLIDLFKTQRITDGPNVGKTVEQANAVQQSKNTDIRVTNPILQPLVRKINDRRKEQSILLRETRLEEETVGLKALSDTSKLVLYGGDYFRIINKTTRSKQIMLKNIGAAGAGLDDRIADKIGSALGNFVGDKISNGLQKRGDRVDPPPKLDLRTLGFDIATDVVSSTLGKLLPEPMIPSKVVQEYEKGRNKKEADFIHEYDIDKRNLKLNSRKKVPKFVDGLLKNNKDILSQTKDVAISTAAGIAGGLVSAGVKGLNNLIFNKTKKNQKTNSGQLQPVQFDRTVYSSENTYSALKKSGLAKARQGLFFETNDLAARKLNSDSVLYEFLNGGDPLPPDFYDALTKTPNKYSTRKEAAKEDRKTNKGLYNTGDIINAVTDVVYKGEVAKNAGEDKTLDEYDFAALKFYSIDKAETLQFRCTVSDLSETFSPTWESTKFIGNPFPFYTYQGIERSLNFNFKVFSLSLTEHKLAWERLNELALYTYPQSYRGISGAIAPPLLRFTLGNMYKSRECFIDSLTFSIDENTPWEVGKNKKLAQNSSPVFTLPMGYTYITDEAVSADKWILPMIINVEISLKFIEARGNTSEFLYSYNT